MQTRGAARSILDTLGDDDAEFVLRLVLASGSLKELAQEYGVSYPTLRGRLDRLIERLKALVAGRPRDPMAELLADLIEKGEIAPTVARSILKSHRQLLQHAQEIQR